MMGPIIDSTTQHERNNMSNLVKYGSYDLETAAEEGADLAASGSGANYLTLKEGDNVVRFLPPPVGSKSPFLVTYEHYIKPVTGDAVSFACPRMMAKQPCPVCEKSKALGSRNNKVDKEAARELQPRRRVFANVIDRTDQEAGPKILGFGKMIQEALVSIRQNKAKGGDFTHPLEGFDIIIERKGSGLATKYGVSAARDDSELGNMEWLEMQNDLSSKAQIKSYDEILEELGASPRSDNGSASLSDGGGRDGGGRGGRRGSRGDNVADAIDVESQEGGSSDQMGW